MLAVSSHVSMQGHHCLPLRVWLWGKCLLCVTVEVITDLEGDHTIRKTFLLFSWNRTVVCLCVFLCPLPRVQCGGKDEGDKANGLSALLNDMIIWAETWTWHSQHYYQFLQESGHCTNNVWNCELRSHNHFHWSPPLQTFLTMHSTLSVLKASHLTFKQEYDSRLYSDSRWLAFGLILMVYAPSLLWFPLSDLNYLLWCTS